MSILECKGLSKRFGAVTALDGISFTIEPGRIVGLCWAPTAAERRP